MSVISNFQNRQVGVICLALRNRSTRKLPMAVIDANPPPGWLRIVTNVILASDNAGAPKE